MAEWRKTSVGIIGLGIIGNRVAALLRRAGHQVLVWNRTPRPEPNFLASPREVAEAADILQLFVRDGAALLEVLGQMEPALGPDHLVMNHSTVSQAETLEASRLVAQRGAGFLDAPFTGSRDAAADGQLVYYVGGPEALLRRGVPVLEASSKAILPMGPVGSATCVKLATNMIVASEIEVLAEALAVMDHGGVPLLRLREALESHGANSGLLAMKLPQMLLGEFEPRFSTKNMLKDLQIALRSVEGAGIDLPSTAATAGALMGAVQAGWGEDDFSSLARHYSYPGSLQELPDPQPPIGTARMSRGESGKKSTKPRPVLGKGKGLLGFLAPRGKTAS